MNGQQHLDLGLDDDEVDRADRIVEQHLATFVDRSQALVTTWGDGSVTVAKRRHRAERWGPPVDAPLAP